jgi:hypothetical protein
MPLPRMVASQQPVSCYKTVPQRSQLGSDLSLPIQYRHKPHYALRKKFLENLWLNQF